MVQTFLFLLALSCYGESLRSPEEETGFAGRVEYIVRVEDVETFKVRALEAVQAKGGYLEIKEELHLKIDNVALIVADPAAIEVIKEDPGVMLEKHADTFLQPDSFSKQGSSDKDVRMEQGWSNSKVRENAEMNMPRDLLMCHKQTTGFHSWGLTRVSSRELPEDYVEGQYHYCASGDGQGVNVYILGTGVYLEHSEFEGRASWGFTGQSIQHEGNSDPNGLGTHIASIVAGKTYGIAKSANIISVRVVGKGGNANETDVIQGLEWVIKDVQLRRDNLISPKGTIVNLAMNYTKLVPSIEKVIQKMVVSGITVVVAAGNEEQDACGVSPARMSSVITVGATDIFDDLSSSSNYGPCVDILAPGEDILGATNTGKDTSSTKSGTSMAAGFVTGVIASYMSSLEEGTDNKLPSQVKAFILSTATPDVVTIPSLSPKMIDSLEAFSILQSDNDWDFDLSTRGWKLRMLLELEKIKLEMEYYDQFLNMMDSRQATPNELLFATCTECDGK